MKGEILVFQPPARLEFTWGDDVLRFELRAEDNGRTTVLDFVDVLEDVGKAARDGAGWHVCLDGLAEHLDGQPSHWNDPDRWRPVHEQYLAEFPPEAATIGPPESPTS
jgi:hypothetical protein